MVLRVKNGAVGGKCNSCGTRSVLDNVHKLAAYILKCPPKNSSEFKKGEDKEKEKEKGKEEKPKKGEKVKEEKEDKKGKHDKEGEKKEEKTAEEKKEVKIFFDLNLTLF